MQIEPLFDLTAIDLDAVALSPDRVGEMNPQSGDMRHLDHVIWYSRDAGQILGVKYVRDDEFWVPGHIPGRPLLPGVIMIEAGAQLASIAFRLKTNNEVDFLAFTRMTDVAFRSQVVPGDRLYLLNKEIECKPRRFTSRVQGIVNNFEAIAFEATISGIVVRHDQGRS